MTSSAWAQQLQPASWRGVPFFVDGHHAEFGRRVVVHDYPFQDLPETEDLGARAAMFRLSAYVIGPDYFPARNRLQAALMQAGAGTLVHPWLGTLQAVVLSVRLIETTREGGVARFDLHLIAASAVTQPSATINTPAAVLAASTAAQAMADQVLQDDWSVNTNSVIDAVSNALDIVFSGIESLIGSAENLSTLGKQLVQLPDQIASRIDGDLRKIDAIASLRKFFIYAPAASIGYNDAASPINALGAHVRYTATLAAAELTAQTAYTSYNDAIAARDVILDQIDAVSEDASTDLYAALQDLRVQTALDIETRAANLAIITRYTPQETVPALVIAQTLYGPIDIEANVADIVARNGILNPLFVPGGMTLEVLTNG